MPAGSFVTFVFVVILVASSASEPLELEAFCVVD